MLLVTLELKPAGDSTARKTIGTIEIANITEAPGPDDTVGDYSVAMRGHQHADATLRGVPRRRDWHMVKDVLEAVLEAEELPALQRAPAQGPRLRVAHPHVDPDFAGSPIVRGSRVPVRRIWAWHRGGASVETLVKRYPNLGPARILDALAFAYDNQDLIEADIGREQAHLARVAGPVVAALTQAQINDPDERLGNTKGGA